MSDLKLNERIRVSHDQKLRRTYLVMNKHLFYPSAIIADVTNQLPFVGIMLYGFKHPK